MIIQKPMLYLSLVLMLVLSLETVVFLLACLIIPFLLKTRHNA